MSPRQSLRTVRPELLGRAAVTRKGAIATPSAKHARTREFGREIAGHEERGRTGAEDMRLVPSGLTAVPAHNLPRSAGRAAHAPSSDLHTPLATALPADLSAAVAVTAAKFATAEGTTAPAPSLASIGVRA
jgi:hypothetical protein